MAKEAEPMKAADYVGKQAMFIVPVRNEGDTVMRVKVKVLEKREKFGRTDLKIEPVAGDGTAWVQSKHLEDVK